MTKESAKPGLRRLLTIAAVTALVVLAAVLVDRAVRNPPCRDGAAALAVVEQKVLPGLEGLSAGEGHALEAGERETLGGSGYYPVAVFLEEGEPPFLTVYVRAKDSRPFVRDGSTGQLIPWGE